MDAWINEPIPEDDEPKDSGLDIFYKTTPVPALDFRESGYQGETSTVYEERNEGEDTYNQRREARRVVQANNPHYLKSSSSSSSRKSPSSQLLSPSASEEIPVVPINLSVPLQISTSTKLSDKYLELERNKETENQQSKKHRSKKDKKKKKSKAKDAKGKPFLISSF